MKLYVSEHGSPLEPVELEIFQVETGCTPAVYVVQEVGLPESQVYFECDGESSFDIIEKAFDAREEWRKNA